MTSHQTSPQRWYVAVLYVDLCGSTELSGQLEPDVYAEVMDGLKAFYGQKIAQHGGTLLQLHGDGLLAMFGFPSAGEEDVRLAVEAALDMHEQVANLQLNVPELAQLGTVFKLHSGVHAGVVVVQEGDIYAGSFQLRSEVTNICARLSGEAGEDEILVSEESLGGSKPYFECGPSRDLALRGVNEPLRVVPVVAKSALSTRDQARRERSRLPFVGRTDEQAILRERYAGAREGVMQIVGVEGAPGVGKSRLMDEFANGLGPDLVLRATCDNPAIARPLQPFVNLLRAAQRSGGTFGECLNQHPALQAILDDQDRDSEVAKGDSEAIYEFIADLVSRQSLVIVLDDWHWVDGASRGVVQRIANNSEWPLLVVLSTRQLDPEDLTLLQPLTTLQLDGLSALEVDAAIKGLLPHVDPFIAQKIGSLCGGNPLFLEELCHSESIDKLDHAPSTVEHVPQWLYSVVQARVAKLSRQEIELVQIAAVIGRRVPLWLLQQVSDYEDGTDLSGLALADLLFPTEDAGEWRFKHGLTREIVYDLVGLRARQSLHRQIAQALENRDGSTDEHLEQLAYHCFSGGMLEPAMRHALAAGDRAMLAPALDIAAVQYRLAIDCLDKGEVDHEVYQQIFSLVRRLNGVNMLDPDPQHIEVLTRVLKLAERFDDKRGLALTNYWLGTTYYGIGHPRQALRYHYRARALAQESGHERLAIETQSTIAQSTAANCEHASALKLLDQAITAHGVTEPGSADQVSVCYTLGSKAMVLGDMGDMEGGERTVRLALESLAGLMHPVEPNVLAKLVLIKIWKEQWTQAVEESQRLGELTERIRNFYLYGMGRALGAYAQWRDHGGQGAADEVKESTGWLESYGKGQFLSLNYGWLCEIAYAEGDVEALRRYAAKGIRRARLGDRFGEASVYRSLARLAATGDSSGNLRPWQTYLRLADQSAKVRSSHREQALNEACREALT